MELSLVPHGTTRHSHRHKSPQHPAWPGGWPSDTWAQTQGGSLRADRLDLALLAALADRLQHWRKIQTESVALHPKDEESHS